MSIFKWIRRRTTFAQFLAEVCASKNSTSAVNLSTLADEYIDRFGVNPVYLTDSKTVERLRLKCQMLRQARCLLDDEPLLAAIDSMLQKLRQLRDLLEDREDLECRGHNLKSGQLIQIDIPNPEIEQLGARMEKIREDMKKGRLSPHTAQRLLDEVGIELDRISLGERADE